MTGAVVLPLLLLFIYFANSFFFGALLSVVAFLAMGEFCAMALPLERVLEGRIASIAAALFLPVLASQKFLPSLGSMVLLLILFSCLFLWRLRGDIRVTAPQLGLIFFGFCYVPLLLSHFAMLHSLEFGRQWVYLLLLIIMCGDSAAYFVGISLGRRKLYPAVSPNKSIEGAIGGLAGSVLGAFIAQLTFFPQLAWWDVLLLGTILGALGQVGDLFESLLKRSFGVKDSGTLIPGHGGILDRLDSLLFAFPPAFYYALMRFSG